MTVNGATIHPSGLDVAPSHETIEDWLVFDGLTRWHPIEAWFMGGLLFSDEVELVFEKCLSYFSHFPDWQKHTFYIATRNCCPIIGRLMENWGPYSWGPYSWGPYSWGLYSWGPYSWGPYSWGPISTVFSQSQCCQMRRK